MTECDIQEKAQAKAARADKRNRELAFIAMVRAAIGYRPELFKVTATEVCRFHFRVNIWYRDSLHWLARRWLEFSSFVESTPDGLVWEPVLPERMKGAN